MADENDAALQTEVAALEHITGPSRGSVTWLRATTLDVYLDAERKFSILEARPGDARGGLIARLHPADDTYEVVAQEDQQVWVNGERVTARLLENDDMVEFGETGPMSRFRLFRKDKPVRKTAAAILSDGIDYLRVSRQPLARRAYRVFCQMLRRLTRETTVLFRTAVVVAILALAGLVYQQSLLNVRFQQRIETDAARLNSFAGALARARSEALTPADLKGLQLDIGRRISSAAERLEALEQRSQASGRVIASAISSVAFLQGAYGFRERSSGRMMRHVVDDAGRMAITSTGRPLLTLVGDGPVAERQYTGTGFAVGDGGAIVTNRHVALPWENDADIEFLTGQGMEPMMIKFIAYLPGWSAAHEVELLKASDDADLAILRRKVEMGPMPGLKLADAPPAPGDEVIVMGYPTGLRSMLAQSGEAFINELQKAGDTGFWSVAARLAATDQIAPLASRGIVGQATSATIVYDAETTHGGSGGPVLDINGAVLAVNTAILPEFGGSNLGVPAAKMRALLKAAGIL
jgi:S1-C subfamily serine protease